MKIYLFEISNPDSIKEKIRTLGHEVCEKNNEAQAVIYGQGIQEFLLSDDLNDKVKYIISSRDFMNKIDPFVSLEFKNQDDFKDSFKDESIGAITQRLNEGIKSVIDKKSFSDLDRFLQLISLELVQNALIYGREQGQDLQVDYSITRSEESYLIEVKDQFGKLDRDNFFKSVRRAYKERAYEMKKSGAGLGLSMILSASDELSINRKEDEFTQIRCIIGKYKRLKEYKSKKTSLRFMGDF